MSNEKFPLEDATISFERSMVKVSWVYQGQKYGFITSKKMLEQGLTKAEHQQYATLMEVKVFDND